MATKRVNEKHSLKDKRERAYAAATKGDNPGTIIGLINKATPKEKILKAEIENLGFLGLPLPEDYQHLAFSLGCYNAGKKRAVISKEEAGRDWYLNNKPLEEHPLHEDIDFINGYNRAMYLTNNGKRGR